MYGDGLYVERDQIANATWAHLGVSPSGHPRYTGFKSAAMMNDGLPRNGT